MEPSSAVYDIRAARDHDRHNQHADFAHHQNAEHIDHVEVSAQSAETEDALLRDDRSDQERDQQDDRNRAPAHAVEVMHHGGQTETAGPDQDAQGREYERAEHLEIEQKIARHKAERAPTTSATAEASNRVGSLRQWRFD